MMSKAAFYLYAGRAAGLLLLLTTLVTPNTTVDAADTEHQLFLPFVQFLKPSVNACTWESGGQIWVYHVDGSTVPKAITHGSYDSGTPDVSPMWAPDNTTIVFLHLKTPPESPKFYRMEADGSNVQELPNAPAGPLSPDLHKAVYWEGETRTVYLVYIDDGIPIPVTTLDNYPIVDWSPDSTHFIMVDQNGGFYGVSLGNRQPKVTISVPTAWKPVWSPDSRQIAYEELGSIFSVGADGKNLRKITSGDDDYLNPVWSPDGTRLLVDRVRVDQQDHIAIGIPSHIYSMSLDGTDFVQFSQETGLYMHKTWADRGKKLFFVKEYPSNLTGPLYDLGVLDADTGQETRLTFYGTWPGTSLYIDDPEQFFRYRFVCTP